MRHLKLDRILSKLEQVAVPDDLQELVVAVRDALRIDHVVYHWVSANGGQYGFGTYDPAWVKRYLEQDYLRIDPVILGCYQRFQPVDWKRLDWGSRAARAFRRDAVAHGVGNQGFSVPIRGPNGQFALFTLSHTTDDEKWLDFTLTHQRDLIILAHYLNQKALELEKGRAPRAVRTLSPREIDALTFLGMGYSRAQVAEMLTISEHTLRAYIESARFKLGALNTTHAVARALSEGLILIGGAERDAQGNWPGRYERGAAAN